MFKSQVHLEIPYIQLDVPYFEQDTNYSCGPASLQMVFAFHGVRTSERKLMREMQTNVDLGTMHRRMIRAATAHGLYCYVNGDSPIEEIAYLLARAAPPIIHYQEMEENIGHYSVVSGVDGQHIFLHDPWNGERLLFLHREFAERWMCAPEDGICRNWLMAVSNIPFQVGRQFLPKRER